MPRSPVTTAALLLAGFTGCVPPLEDSLELTLVAERVLPSPPGEELRELRFRAPDGSSVQGVLRRPAAAGSRRAGVLLIAGRETGRKAATVIPGPLLEVVLALEYPAELPVDGTALPLRSIPEIRRTAYRVPGLLRGAARWLAALPEVDAGRILLVGVSYGVPFAAAAGTDSIFRGVTLQHGGADLALLLRHNLPVRQPLLRRAAASAAARYVRSLEPARHVGHIAPTPLLLINAEHDELVPRASAVRLHRAAGAPKRIVWLPHGHLMPDHDPVMRELADSTLAHFGFLRGPPR
jgi:hypothetical protein